MIRVGFDSEVKKFTTLEFKTEDPAEGIKFGDTSPDTIISTVMAEYELIGIYSSMTYNPFNDTGGLEQIQCLFNTCMEGPETEPDVLDYLLHQYIGIGDTSGINSRFNTEYVAPEDL